MKLIFLGTSGSIPTVRRGLPAIALMQKEELYSFDREEIHLSLDIKIEYFHFSQKRNKANLSPIWQKTLILKGKGVTKN